MSFSTAIMRAFDSVIDASWQASIIAVLILIVQRILPRRFDPRWRCAIWCVLFLRLAIPVLPESRFSLFNFRPQLLQPALITLPDKVTEIHLDPATGDDAKAVSAQPATADSTSINWRQILAAAWIAGIFVTIGRTGRASALFSKAFRSDGQPCSPMLLGKLLACCNEMGIRQAPRILETSAVRSPALYGFAKPVLLLPAGLMQRLDPSEQRFVLLHELVHLKRQDILISLGAWVFNAIHWFNPVLWLATARFRGDRELLCDAQVIQLTKHSKPIAYGKTIIKLLESAASLRPRLPALAAMLGGRSSIHRRLLQIAEPQQPSRLWSILAVLLITVIGCITLTRAQTPTSAPGSIQLRVFDIHQLIELMAEPSSMEPAQFEQFGVTPLQNAKASATAPSKDKQQVADNIVAQLKRSVAPESWSNGDPAAPSIEAQDGLLLVRQTQNVLDQIAASLKVLEKDHGTQLYVESRFLGGEAAEGIVQQRTFQWEKRGDIEVCTTFLDAKQVDELLKVVQATRTTTTLTAPRMTLFNRQRGIAIIANDRDYVAAINESPDGTPDPVIKRASTGCALECRAEVLPDGQSILLSLHPKLSELLEIVSTPWPAPPAKPRPGVFTQVPKMVITEFDERFTIPAGKYLLIKLQPKIEPPDPQAPPQKPKFALFRAMIVVQKEGAP